MGETCHREGGGKSEDHDVSCVGKTDRINLHEIGGFRSLMRLSLLNPDHRKDDKESEGNVDSW